MRCVPLYLALAAVAQLAFASPVANGDVADVKPRVDHLYMMGWKSADEEPESEK